MFIDQLIIVYHTQATTEAVKIKEGNVLKTRNLGGNVLFRCILRKNWGWGQCAPPPIAPDALLALP